MFKMITLFAILGSLNVWADANRVADILRCEARVQPKSQKGVSVPASYLFVDSHDFNSAKGFVHQRQEFIFSTHTSQPIVHVLKEGIVVQVNVEGLLEVLRSGKYKYQSAESQEVTLSSGDTMKIICFGVSERQVLLQSINTAKPGEI